MSKGFTLIEILIVIALIGILAAVAAFGVGALAGTGALESAHSIVVQTLEDAHNRSATGIGTSTYGVHITNTAIIEFNGSGYVPGEGVTLPLPAAVSTDQASTTIVFSRITAAADATATIVIKNAAGLSKTVDVLSSGAIVDD